MPIHFRHDMLFYFLPDSRLQELHLSFLFFCKLVLRPGEMPDCSALETPRLKKVGLA
jgi:hypothetical protein